MGVTATVQRMTQFVILLSCDSELKSDRDFQLSGSGSNSLNWRKLPGRFSLPKRPGNEAKAPPVCAVKKNTQYFSSARAREEPGNKANTS